MSKIAVVGGKRLFGAVTPSGSKNATLPMIFASIACRGTSRLRFAADIGDVAVAVKIIEHLGARVEKNADSLVINTENMTYKKPPSALTSKIRASSYLIGSCLARFGMFELSDVGGCNFCNRPIDMHVSAALSLGAELKDGTLYAKRLRGGKIRFDKSSVGATINALIMSASADGEVEILGAAEEPHVRSLADYLIRAGAKIELSRGKISVYPSELSGAEVDMIPDMIEAGTFLLLAPLTEGKIKIKTTSELELDSFLEVLSESGVSVLKDKSGISVWGVPSRPINIKTAPHPGYPTDLQPQIAPLMAKYFGGIIEESVWQKRLSYLDSLSSFGVRHTKTDSRAVIFPSELHRGVCDAPDLRGGAAALMSALATVGYSEIGNYEIIKRGYENLSAKLNSLGAEALEIN